MFITEGLARFGMEFCGGEQIKFGNLHTSYFTADLIVFPSGISTFAI
jgi:hypothetical protein